jgi:hypothetical protein
LECKISIFVEDSVVLIASTISYSSLAVFISVLSKNDLSRILDFTNFNCIFCSATLQCYIIVRSYRISLLIVLRFFLRENICLKMRSTELAFYILRSVAVFFSYVFSDQSLLYAFLHLSSDCLIGSVILFLSKRSLSNILV